MSNPGSLESSLLAPNCAFDTSFHPMVRVELPTHLEVSYPVPAEFNPEVDIDYGTG